MSAFRFRFADKKDRTDVVALLATERMPTQDLPRSLDHFILACQGSQVIGCVGLEPLKGLGLLRSLAVLPRYRGRAVGGTLVDRLTAYARQLGLRELFLLTTDAAGFFQKRGFRRLSRRSVPKSIQATEQFKSLCPSTAVCMARSIAAEAVYYPKDLLRLKPDVPGSVFWGISLDKTMLTYFEVKPRSRFQRHKHASEQITLVLQGELFFQMDGRTVRLGEGEAIAIPSNVPHAVFTKSKGAKAVDAWSPVMDLYKS